MDKREEATILVEFQGMKRSYVCLIKRRILKSARLQKSNQDGTLLLSRMRVLWM